MPQDFSSLTTYRLLLEKTNINGHEILLRSNEQEALQIDAKLGIANKKWKKLIALLNEVKDKFSMSALVAQTKSDSKSDDAATSSSIAASSIMEQSPYQFMNKRINEHNEWLAKFNDLFAKEISPMDQLENERLLFELNVRNTQFSGCFSSKQKVK